MARLVVDLEGGAALRPHFSAVVDAGGGDVGVPQPFLHLGDVGLMLQRVGRCCRPQRVRPEADDIDLERGGVAGQHFVDAVGRDRGAADADVVTPGTRHPGRRWRDRPTLDVDGLCGGGMQRQVAQFATLTVNT